MPAHILHGDSYLVAQALRGFQESVGPPEVLEANSHNIIGAQAEPGLLRGLCSAVPFLAEYRLILVEGLLSLLEARPGRRRASGTRARGSATSKGRGSLTDWDFLPEYIGEEMPPTTLLVFLEATISRANPLLKRLTPVASVQELTTPSGEALARWIRNRVEEKGARITPGAIRLLSQLVGGNLWTMDNELEKLALFVGQREIAEADVRTLVSQAREANIFNAVDALLEAKPGVALGLMHRLRDDGAEFPYITNMVARQLRLLALARDLIDRGHGQREIGERLGLTHEFALKRTMGQARRHSWSSIRWLYGELMEADLAVKQGRLEQDLALDILVGEATRLGPRPGQSSTDQR